MVSSWSLESKLLVRRSGTRTIFFMFMLALVLAGCNPTAPNKVEAVNGMSAVANEVVQVDPVPIRPIEGADDAADDSAQKFISEATIEPIRSSGAENFLRPGASGGSAANRAMRLSIGDPHPDLQVSHWIGDVPVDQPLMNRVHVVVFWATWSGPCRDVIESLTELQTEYADDLTIIAVTREPVAIVNRFLDSASSSGHPWRDSVGFSIAIDDNAQTSAAYMNASGRRGIPAAFIIGPDGTIQWSGLSAGLQQALEVILHGNWDRQTAIAEEERDYQLDKASLEISRLVRSRDWDGALERIDCYAQEYGSSHRELQLRMRLLEMACRFEQASLVRRQLVESAWHEPELLNRIAWSAATNLDSPDLELALRAAHRSAELLHEKDPSTLETLARCYYESGDLDRAIEWQRLAVEVSQGAIPLTQGLNSYLAEQANPEQAITEQAADGQFERGCPR